jgi:hypothetical protein
VISHSGVAYSSFLTSTAIECTVTETLRDYVHALGGELQLMVTFQEGTRASIKNGVKSASR